jgi:hypothetical protein
MWDYTYTYLMTQKDCAILHIQRDCAVLHIQKDCATGGLEDHCTYWSTDRWVRGPLYLILHIRVSELNTCSGNYVVITSFV